MFINSLLFEYRSRDRKYNEALVASGNILSRTDFYKTFFSDEYVTEYFNATCVKIWKIG